MRITSSSDSSIIYLDLEIYTQINKKQNLFKVLNLVGEQVFNRYDNLLLKDSLNSMTDIIYCPRADCQCAVIPVFILKF